MTDPRIILREKYNKETHFTAYQNNGMYTDWLERQICGSPGLHPSIQHINATPEFLSNPENIEMINKLVVLAEEKEKKKATPEEEKEELHSLAYEYADTLTNDSAQNIIVGDNVFKAFVWLVDKFKKDLEK
jgi:hypothetical protein